MSIVCETLPTCRAVLAIPARPRAAGSGHDKAPGGCRGLFKPPLIPRWRQAAYLFWAWITGNHMVPHAGLAPTHTQPGDAHPPADRRRWLCDIVSGLQGHDAYADRAAGCVAGGIKHGHAHTGYMIAAGCCAGPAAAKEETWKAVCLTIPWYQFTPSKVTWRDILKPLSLFGAAVLRGAPKYRVGWRS